MDSIISVKLAEISGLQLCWTQWEYEGIQILTTLNTSNERIEHSPEASRPAEHLGPVLGDIQE